MPGVEEVVLSAPGLAAVDRSLAELTDFAGCHWNELQVALQLMPVRLRNFVRPVIHDTVVQVAVEEDDSGSVVHPVLFPAMQVLVIGVVALAEVAAGCGGPILPDDAAAHGRGYVTAALSWPSGYEGNIPVADPVVELMELRLIAWGGVFVHEVQQAGEARIAAHGSPFNAVFQAGWLGKACVRRGSEGFKSVGRISRCGIGAGQFVVGQGWW